MAPTTAFQSSWFCVSVSFLQSIPFSSCLPFSRIGCARFVLSSSRSHTSGTVILKDSLKVSVCSEITSSSPFLWQVHIHRDLYIWITSENHCKRFLHRWLYLFTGSVELVRFQCHHDGVSCLLTLLMFLVWLRMCGCMPGCVRKCVCGQLEEALVDNRRRPNGPTPVILACEGNDSMFMWEKVSQGFVKVASDFPIDVLSYVLCPYNTDQGLHSYYHGALVKTWHVLGVNLKLKISFLGMLVIAHVISWGWSRCCRLESTFESGNMSQSIQTDYFLRKYWPGLDTIAREQRTSTAVC